MENRAATLAAELRLRARDADPRERDELLFLAAEYERIAALPGSGDRRKWRGLFLPK